MALNNHLLAVCIIIQSVAAASLPFIVLHGIGDQCKNRGMSHFTERLSNMSGSQGYCIEIGNGASDSWFMPLSKQVQLACKTVNSISELKGGYSIVGLSQGNLIGRGVIEWCDGPMVYNMVSLGGPHAGIGSVPMCTVLSICELADVIMELGIYSRFVQNHLAPSGYIKMPNDLSAYYKGCQFLPKLNNELPHLRNSEFKRRLSSINQFVLVMFKMDTVLVPRETAWFGFYNLNNESMILPMEETDLYKEDWIGLKSMNEEGRIKFVEFAGNHLSVTQLEMSQHIAPYLM